MSVFDILDKSSLVKFLEYLDPKSVLSLLQTTRSFDRIRDDQSVFVQLMKVHYPYVPINENAKAQYMATAGDEKITYWFFPDPAKEVMEAVILDDIGIKGALSKTGIPLATRSLGVEFSIRTSRILKGTLVWILSSRHANVYRWQHQLFTNEKDVYDSIVENSNLHEEEMEEMINILRQKGRVVIGNPAKYVAGMVHRSSMTYTLYRVILP